MDPSARVVRRNGRELAVGESLRLQMIIVLVGARPVLDLWYGTGGHHLTSSIDDGGARLPELVEEQHVLLCFVSLTRH